MFDGDQSDTVTIVCQKKIFHPPLLYSVADMEKGLGDEANERKIFFLTSIYYLRKDLR